MGSERRDEANLQRAMLHHRRGELAQAKALYGKVLESRPGHFDALHLLGVIAAQTHRPEMAVEMIGKALRSHPQNAAAYAAFSNMGAALADLGELDRAVAAFDRSIAIRADHTEAHCRRGNALRALKRWDAALASYDRAISIQPRFAAAHLNRGLLLQDLRQFEAAIQSFSLAVASRSDYAEAYFNRGNAQLSLRDWDAALASYHEALAINSDYVEAHCNCGLAFTELRQWDAAIACFDRAIEIKADCPEAYSNRGNVQSELRQWGAAVESYDQAIAIRADYAEAYSNRAGALRALGQWDAAIASANHAISISPDHAAAHSNLGSVYQELQRFDAALDCYNQAIALNADYAEAHGNKAVLLLQRGDFEDGWNEYEWRWKSKLGSNIREKRHFNRPLWIGQEPLAGKAILLHAEQGLGDTLQFCRYVKLVAALDAVVILEVQAPLAGLLATLKGVSNLIVKGSPLPEFDFQCPLLSLPLAFKTHLGSIPAAARYLESEAAKREQWESLLGARVKPRIGLVWSGGAFHKNDRHRSLRLAHLIEALPPGFQYVSLQKEVRELDEQTLRAHPAIGDFAHQLSDFSDTAALCDCMDLVISVDTGVAHLSGALGKRTWLLVPFNSDWRWLLGRDDSPWYPSVKLYRQAAAGDWSGVLARLGAELLQTFNSS